MTFTQVATEWYNMHSVGLSSSTKHGYLYNLNHIDTITASQDIRLIKYGDLQIILNTKAANGFSQRTVTGIRHTMIMVFKHAVKSDYVNKNVADYTCMPHFVQATPDKCITVQEADLIQRFKHKYDLFALTLLFTGIRRGEALALTWQDIDFNKSVITISKSIEFIGNHALVKSPKTANSYRTIPIPNPLMQVLIENRKSSHSDLLFTQISTGNPHTQTSYKKMWQRWYNDFAIYYYRETGSSAQHLTAHMLRHYYITYLFENNIPDLIIQKVAGHAEIAFTRKRYTHIRQSFQEQCYQNIINLYP